MDPTKKDEQLDRVLVKVFGVDRRAAIQTNTCVAPPIGCGGPINTFRDELSEREYRISGLCQECQDDIFGQYAPV